MIEADFHIHSKYSPDSFLTPQTIVRVAKRKGLSVVAVTDHTTIRGALETARRASEQNDLLVIQGMEVRTSIGDIIGLFLEGEVASTDVHEAIDEIKKQGGLVILPHPFKRHENISEELVLDIDVIEALNGRSSIAENSKARRLAVSMGKPIIAGSDAHISYEIGRVRTIFSDSPATLDDLKKSIIKGNRKLVGRESPFIVHAFSFGTGIVKRIIG
jgi:predicted metal-dependent phosphoesterase TrpH